MRSHSGRRLTPALPANMASITPGQTTTGPRTDGHDPAKERATEEGKFLSVYIAQMMKMVSSSK